MLPRPELVELLACPACGGPLSTGDVSLSCSACGVRYPVLDGIPTFVESESYADSFGLQWNRYRRHQLDSMNGTSLSRRRFFAETGLDPSWLAGKTVLDAGCGAGRFSEIAAEYAKQVVALDMSSAIRAAKQNLRRFDNVDYVQASITSMPFKKGAFDAVFCIGVAQHTPSPSQTVRALQVPLRSGGRLAVTSYERRRFTRLHGKYIVRRFSRHASPETLGRIVHALMPVLFPITEILFRIPGVRKVAKFVLPVANYVDEPDLSLKSRYEWALLDTVDMLTPAHDHPMTEAEVREALGDGVRGLERLPNPGVNVVAHRV